MAFVDAKDSFWGYVRDRIQADNSARIVHGMMSAQEWPMKNVDFEAFYLLTLSETPIGKQGYSATVPIVFHEMQWVWVIKGADISAGKVGANRGERFRTNEQMKGELEQALYPYFCEKKTWALDNPSAQKPNWVGTSLDPLEYIGWVPPIYHSRIDRESGLVYGAVAVRVFDMLDPILA